MGSGTVWGCCSRKARGWGGGGGVQSLQSCELRAGQSCVTAFPQVSRALLLGLLSRAGRQSLARACPAAQPGTGQGPPPEGG